MRSSEFPIPEGGITDIQVLRAAFAGGPYGEHGLIAIMRTPRIVQGPIPEVQMPVEMHWEVTGYFLDGHGHQRGHFRRCLYRRGPAKDIELWLGGFHVDEQWRGGMFAFARQGLEVCAVKDVRRARGVAGRTLGGLIWAHAGFEFDPERLPGFGDDGKGVGRGGEHMKVPRKGAHIERKLVRAIVRAARADGRITRREAWFLGRRRLDSPSAMAGFGDLSDRLLAGSRWPMLREL